MTKNLVLSLAKSLLVQRYCCLITLFTIIAIIITAVFFPMTKNRYPVEEMYSLIILDQSCVEASTILKIQL